MMLHALLVERVMLINSGDHIRRPDRFKSADRKYYQVPYLGPSDWQR